MVHIILILGLINLNPWSKEENNIVICRTFENLFFIENSEFSKLRKNKFPHIQKIPQLDFSKFIESLIQIAQELEEKENKVEEKENKLQEQHVCLLRDDMHRWHNLILVHF